MQIKAAIAVMQKDLPQSIHLLENAQQLSVEALDDVRSSVSSLREDNLGALSLGERIIKLIDSSKSTERNFNFHIEGNPRAMTPQVDVSLFRVVQEAINNANKHSKSTEVNITLNFDEPDIIKLNISDNGKGSETPDGGFGLIGMKERIRLINGNFEIKTAKGCGFSIFVSVPG